MIRVLVTIMLATLAAWVLSPLAARAAPERPRAAPCPEGTFVLVAEALTDGDAVPASYRIAIADAQATVSGICDVPVRASVKAKESVTLIKASWAACRGFAGKVRLKAKLDARSCNTMTGVLRARRSTPRKQRFTATRVPAAPRFSAPAECATCHPRQYAEWQGSMMAYGAVSPVFNALEAAGNAMLGGAFAADGDSPLFCQRCHAPVSVALGEFPAFAATEGRPSRDFMGEVGAHGLSCDFCHQVSHAELDGSLLGDGIANSAFVLAAGPAKLGPIHDPIPSRFHDAAPSQYLSSPEFCGSCHDVRIPAEDAITGEPFRRLEDAFSEWERGPYATTANPLGRVVTCQDCHMSAYPYAPPGTYFTDRAAAVAGAPLRRVSSHYFTGVDVALIDFPGQDDDALDSHGVPIGQRQRREDLLRAACTLALETPAVVAPGDTLPVVVAVTNTGAGHNVPTGFSQERQMWIELIVSDADGAIVYESGYLRDRAHPETGELAPDGNLGDEDLQNWIGLVDPTTMEADFALGPDHNRRPAQNLGLVKFGNEFLRAGPHGMEEVFVPFLATAMDNTHSIPPLATVRPRYDVPIPDGARGPLHVAVRLRFRAFPPSFLRMLAQARPDLVDEALVDRNLVVEMAAARTTVVVQRLVTAASVAPEP